jgi:hypothetical protein
MAVLFLRTAPAPFDLMTAGIKPMHVVSPAAERMRRHRDRSTKKTSVYHD